MIDLVSLKLVEVCSLDHKQCEIIFTRNTIARILHRSLNTSNVLIEDANTYLCLLLFFFFLFFFFFLTSRTISRVPVCGVRTKYRLHILELVPTVTTRVCETQNCFILFKVGKSQSFSFL